MLVTKEQISLNERREKFKDYSFVTIAETEEGLFTILHNKLLSNSQIEEEIKVKVIRKRIYG